LVLVWLFDWHTDEPSLTKNIEHIKNISYINNKSKTNNKLLTDCITIHFMTLYDQQNTLTNNPLLILQFHTLLLVRFQLNIHKLYAHFANNNIYQNCGALYVNCGTYNLQRATNLCINNGLFLLMIHVFNLIKHITLRDYYLFRKYIQWIHNAITKNIVSIYFPAF